MYQTHTDINAIIARYCCTTTTA